MKRSKKVVEKGNQCEDTLFTKITMQDIQKLKQEISKKKRLTKNEKQFIRILKKAIRKIKHDYWILDNPSVVKAQICFTKKRAESFGFSFEEWKNMAKEYAPNRGSRLANIYELAILHALRFMEENMEDSNVAYIVATLNGFYVVAFQGYNMDTIYYDNKKFALNFATGVVVLTK